MSSEGKLFCLGSNRIVSEAIANQLNRRLGSVKCQTFADGEQLVVFDENVRECNIFLIQTLNSAEAWMRLFVAIDAAIRSAATRVTVVLPYFGYGRQDRQAHPREPISASMVATIIHSLGVKHVLTMDLHNPAIAGFFHGIPVDNIYGRPVLVKAVAAMLHEEDVNLDDVVFASPDVGGIPRARSYAERVLGYARLAVIHKERKEANQVESMTLVGDVKGKTVVLVDDLGDTCSTLDKASRLVLEEGAKSVYACLVHGLFSVTEKQSAITTLEHSPIKKLLVTDSVIAKQYPRKVKIVSCGELLGEAIRCIETGTSLSEYMEHH